MMMTARARFTTLCSAAVAAAALIAAALAPAGAAAATGTGANFGPSVVTNELHLATINTATEDRTSLVLHWKGANRYRELTRVGTGANLFRTVFDQVGGAEIYADGVPTAARKVTVVRNGSAASPDWYDSFDAALMDYAWPFVARVRAGGTPLVPLRTGGRDLLRGTMAVTANECAGLRAGTRTVYLDAATLVPVRVVEVRGGTTTIDLKVAPRTRSAADFAALTVIGSRSYRNNGFLRRTPAQSAEKVPFPVSMPAALPAGFELARTGYAVKGSVIGPEGSMPQSKGMFFARWNRGIEPLELTIRGARGTLTADWDRSDPFGVECGSAKVTDVRIGTVTGHYGVSDTGSPALWWRTGTILYTLRGPFSGEQLATIARSLAPIDEG